MKKENKGKCRICNKEFTKKEMIEHLKICNRKSKCFEIVIEDAYDKDYWLIIKADENLLLKHLDNFIRDIWVECCGHLSNFRIDGTVYENEVDEDFPYMEKVEDMNILLKDVLKVGQKIDYEYDYGDSTDLVLNVLKHDDWDSQEYIDILARNEAKKYICSYCNKNKGKYIDAPTTYEDTQTYICNTCWNNEEDEKDGKEHFWLNVCNSPRMGICAYEGGKIDKRN